MTVVITMAGMGSRFKERGYRLPKFRIAARGRALIEWSLLSLQAFFEQRFVFVCLAEESEEWITSTAIALGITNCIVAKRPSVSRGQAETAFDALMHVDWSQPLWIYNIDTYVVPGVMRPQEMGAAAGCIPVFQCSESNMSFVCHGSGNDVIEIAEKRPISRWATVGLYGFSSTASFSECYEETYELGGLRATHAERYVAPVYERMLVRGERIVAPRLESGNVNVLGTPDQVLNFDPAALPPFGNSACLTESNPRL